MIDDSVESSVKIKKLAHAIGVKQVRSEEELPHLTL